MNDELDGTMPLWLQAALWNLQSGQAKLKKDQAKLKSDQADVQMRADDLASMQTAQCKKRALVSMETSEREKRARGDQRDVMTQADALAGDEFTVVKGTGPLHSLCT